VVGFLLIRREQDRSRQWPHLRRLLWTGSLVTLLVPAIAFATGFGASDARDTLPEGLVSVPVGGVSGSLDAPVGHYQVVTHRGTQLVATLRAGGEDFEARFPALAGSLRFDPSDLLQPMQIDVRAQASSVDTGIDLRSKHAREELKVESNTFVEFRLGRLLAAEPRDGGIAFSATGEVTLVGRKHAVEVTGTIELADADAQKRLQTAGPTLLVRAALNIDIAETVIGNDGTFDQNKIPISVSLVLVHTSKEAPK